ncbi:MAG: peptidoglycan-binding protein, partial [Methylococcaceae bacterium]|nr:peptidoglycan-binding protein [Methylococcaceae bacterium]
VCNGHPEIFKDSAIRKIYKLSLGIPRVINILCDRALLGAYSTNTYIITPKIVSGAANETLGSSDAKLSYLTALFALLFLACIPTGLYFLKYWPETSNQAIVKLATSSPAIQTKPETINQTRQPDPKTPLPIEKINTAPAAKAKTFHDWINNPDYSLNSALINALKIWGKPIPESNQADCHYVETMGLRCVFGKANWKDLVDTDRPAILEFSLTGGEKRHALLTGFEKNQSMIHFQDNMTFPVADVLAYWNGYYVILELPPISDFNPIYPRHTSNNVLWLRYMLNNVDGKSEDVKQPRFYDDNLVARVINFQHEHQLPEDGKVGNNTMAHLKKIASGLDFPHLQITD